AFLPELAQGESLGRVSGWGWSLGYLGGLLTLGLCLGYVTWAQAHGQEPQQFVPVTMLITAATFAAASLPTFLVLKERARAVPLAAGENLTRAAFARLAQTLRQAARYRDLARFLICIVFYQAGIQTVIALAALTRNKRSVSRRKIRSPRSWWSTLLPRSVRSLSAISR